MAVHLMTGLATGRGGHLAHETTFLDNRHVSDQDASVVVVRAMSDFSRKEVAVYNSLKHSEPNVVVPTFSQGQDTLFSVERLTEDFIVGLQADFPATVPTVLKTGAKLKPDKINRPCVLCGGDSSTLEAASASLDASKFSQLVSLRGPRQFSEESLAPDALGNLNLDASGDVTEEGCETKKKDGQCCGAGDGACGSKQDTSDVELDKNLCHSCRVVTSKMESTPDFLAEQCGKMKRREAMRNEIDNFLL